MTAFGVDHIVAEQAFFEDQVATDKFPARSSGNSSVRQQGSPRGGGVPWCPGFPVGPSGSFLVVVLVFALLMLRVLRLLLSLSVAAATSIVATAAATTNALEIDGFLRSQHVSTRYAQSEGEPTPPNIGKIKCVIILYERVFGDCSSLLSGSGLD